MSLTERYLKRLNLDVSVLSRPKTELLKTLHSRHLECIPFENTAQHGVLGGPAVLDVSTTARKILDKKRGGFCLEVNVLFGAWLEELGFVVTRVPAHVCNDGVFLADKTHIVLIVDCDDQQYFCDVGFGEPAMHPLLYVNDVEHNTPEGMCSVFRCIEDDIILNWMKDGTWKPRLKWSYNASQLGIRGPFIEDFETSLKAVQNESSPFAQKLIVCLITQHRKTTLAGNKLKITDKRFSVDESVAYTEITSNKHARETLRELFGYPLESSEGLDLTRSVEAHPSTWGHI
jgi:N-hydroxyarylamine O-acetyltransferase